MDPQSGGPCQGIRNTIAAMKPLNISNEVVCLDSPGAGFIGLDDFKIHALGPAKSPWGYSKNLIPWLIDNAPRFDAIIAHGMWLFPSFAVMKAMQKLRDKSGKSIVPWYLMPHGMLDPYFQTAPDRKLKSLRNKLYWPLVEEKVVRNADALLFTCQEELNLARKTFKKYEPKAEWNVGYGIQSPPAFEQTMTAAFLATTGLTSNDKYLLFLSRIHPKKGVDLLLNSFAEILQKADTVIADIPKLVIAGPGLTSDFGAELLAKVKNNELLKNQVIFPGMLTGNAKWGAFYNAEAFVLPSHQENFGIAVAEALACKTPVLISNQVNIWREIEMGKGGIIADDTHAGTSQLLETWFSMSDIDKKKMSISAEATYHKKFTITSNIETLINRLFGQIP